MSQEQETFLELSGRTFGSNPPPLTAFQTGLECGEGGGLAPFKVKNANFRSQTGLECGDSEGCSESARFVVEGANFILLCGKGGGSAPDGAFLHFKRS